MSLFPSEHMSVAITPTAVATIAYKGRWRPVLYDSHEVRFDEGGLDNVLVGLSHALNAWAQPGATVRYSVSNAFVRAALLPWSNERLSADEERVLALQRFTELYGDMDGWRVQMNGERQYGQASLAFAMPTRLVDEVLAMSRQYGLDCREITPSAVHSWNRHGAPNPAPHLLFAVVDSGYGLFLATQAVGKLSAPVSARMMVLASDVTTLQMALRREVILQGLEEKTVYFCEAFGELSQEQFDDVRVGPVRTKTSIAMAMATDGWGV